jgi:oxygen-dependent protoporphyrinogen oxidase
VERAGGAAAEADAVIVAVPSGQAAALVAGLDRVLTETLASIPFASTAVVHLGFHRHDIASDLDGYGYVIPRREGSDVLACSWTSSKWEDRAPPGTALLRLYTRRQGSDEELEALARDELRVTMDITAAPVLMRIFRWQAALPQYTLDHPRRLDQIEARCAGLDGLYLAGASYRGVGIPDCIESGSRAARQAMESVT